MEHEFEEWQQAVLPKLSIKVYIEKNQICILYMYLQFIFSSPLFTPTAQVQNGLVHFQLPFRNTQSIRQKLIKYLSFRQTITAYQWVCQDFLPALPKEENGKIQFFEINIFNCN